MGLKVAWLLIIGVNLSLASSMHRIVVGASHGDQYVSFSLTHRDAESSPLRSAEADPADLPQDMPMRAYVAAGRALNMQYMQQQRMKAGKPLAGKFSYRGEPSGDFYLTVPVGTPSQDMIFLLDTGSEFPWTQCSPCLKCTNTSLHRFAYQQSSSFLAVQCDSQLCANSLGLLRQPQECHLTSAGAAALCGFRVRYGDGSIDQGFYSIDSFNLGPKFSKPFVFGCANFVYETVSTSSSGLIGLDAGPFSFTSQLFAGNPDMPKKFAYCLPDRFKSLDAPGRIEFGNYEPPVTARYTPLAPPYGPLGSIYYYVKLEGIAVGETLIKVDMEAGRMKGGGTIFDSGSALTSLVKPVYEQMVREMKRQTAHLGPITEESLLCYEAPLNAKEPPNVPRMSMHFAGGVALELGPGSILRPVGIIDNKSIGFCLAFDMSSINQLNIIGNYQQQNYWVEHNLQTSSLGLAKAKCAH